MNIILSFNLYYHITMQMITNNKLYASTETFSWEKNNDTILNKDTKSVKG